MIRFVRRLQPEELHGLGGRQPPSMGGTSRGESRGSSTRSVRGSGCNSPGLLGLGVRSPGATHRNIYVGSQAAAERTLQSIAAWIEKHLRLEVNAAKSGAGRVEERKFLGFRLDREGRIGVAPESIARCKAKVREMWNARQSLTSRWSRYVRDWWELLPAGGRARAGVPAGGLDAAAHPEMFLAALALFGGPCAAVAGAGRACPVTGPRAQQPGRVAHGTGGDAIRAHQRHAAPIAVPHAIRSRRALTGGWAQPPDAENRTSGGVGECRGIPRH